jgi:GxxExxY protein
VVSRLDLRENYIGTEIVTSAMAVHSFLGPGLLESTYETCLAYEISSASRSQTNFGTVALWRLSVEDAYRIDILVADLVVVEVKAVETVLPVHRQYTGDRY